METLESLRDRISSAEQLQSLVRSMKALSAASINQFEHGAETLREFDETVLTGLQAALRDRRTAVRGGAQDTGRAGVIVIGSDRGLCGRFNEAVADAASEHVRELSRSLGQARVMVAGERALTRLSADGIEADRTFFLPASMSGLSASAQSMLIALDAWRREHDVKRIDICYNQRPDGDQPRIVLDTMLPISPERLVRLAEKPWPSRRLPVFTVDPGELFSWLVRQHLFVRLSKALAESLASEHSARLRAMQRAERNISDHLRETNAAFRHARQNAITTELLDVVSGFETLRSADEEGFED